MENRSQLGSQSAVSICQHCSTGVIKEDDAMVFWFVLAAPSKQNGKHVMPIDTQYGCQCCELIKDKSQSLVA